MTLARRALASAARRLRDRRVRHAPTLSALAAAVDGELAVCARHLDTGRTLALDADRPQKLASLVKVPLAVHVLACVEDGRLRLGDVVPIRPQHVCPGSGVIAERIRVPGLSLSVENLLRLALAESDNTASDALFDLVGGPDAVQDAVVGWGHEVRVDRTIRAMLADMYAVEIEPGTDTAGVFDDVPSESHLRAFMDDPSDTASASAVVDLLGDLWAGRLLPPESTAWLLSALGDCTTGRRRFPAGLPQGAVVAQKTGTLWAGRAGRVVADAAIFRLPRGGHVGLAAFLVGSRLRRHEQEVVLARVAQIAELSLADDGRAP